MHIDNQSSAHTSTSQPINVHTSAHASSESQATTITKHLQQLHAYLRPIKEGMRVPSFLNFFHKRPKLSTIVGIYSLISLWLIKTNHLMNNSDSWCQWKKEYPLTALGALDQSVLTKQLLNNIQHRYLSTANPTDPITPCSRFITTLQGEQKIIQRYITLTTWLSRFWLKKIFPYNSNKVQQAKNALARLAFLHALFVDWASTQTFKQ